MSEQRLSPLPEPAADPVIAADAADPESLRQIAAATAELNAELIALRRDLHAHPEVGYEEHRTTRRITEVLSAAGLEPRPVSLATGLVVDIDPADATPGADRIGFRADIDALPIAERSGLPYASVHDGVSHACGHDVHTTIAVGVALVAARLRDHGRLPYGIRIVFQPAEEVQPGGARPLVEDGLLDQVAQVYALHCDPKVEVGRFGLRVGPLTSAADQLEVRLTGKGGHTSRPHLTHDLVGALAAVATQTPLLLSRRVDPRGGVSLIWGRIRAGSAANAIPREGVLAGTLRALDPSGWHAAGEILEEIISQIVAPYRVGATISHERGVPPTVNHAVGIERFGRAITETLGPDAAVGTDQSLGGEDFAWMLRAAPGAMARLGVKTPGAEAFPDIHQPDFTVDERAIGIGVRVVTRLLTLPR